MPSANPPALALLRARIAAAVADFLGADFRGPVLATIRTETGERFSVRVLPGHRADSSSDSPADSSDAGPDPGPGPDAYPPGVLPQRIADILEAAGQGWQTSIELSAAAGWNLGGWWRGTIARLCRLGWLERDPLDRRRIRRTDRGTRRMAEHSDAEAREE